jgi:16S rRNA G966 N2-methylase RsmD
VSGPLTLPFGGTGAEPGVASGVVAESLEAVDWSFEDSSFRDLTHDLHPWPAKFIPDIPATAIELFTSPGDVVLDPFAGCGTTAVEALRAHRNVVSMDVNPLAVLITEAKCTVVGTAVRQRIAAWAEQLQSGIGPARQYQQPPIPNIDYWFDPPVIVQLAALLNEIEAFGEAQPFLKAVLSSIIVAVSHQESETRYRRIDRDVSEHDVVARFQRRLDVGLSMLARLDACVGGSTSKAVAVCADARSFTKEIEGVKADLAVFSPPYPNAFDYHLYHRFRMFWLGMDPRLVKHDEIGAHLKYESGEKWRDDMAASFGEITATVRPEGHVVCVVGDGIIKGEAFPSGDVLSDVGRAWGLRLVRRVERKVSRTRRAFNLSDSRLREEHVLIFQR